MIAFVGSDINNATTFLSITVDNPISGAVADEFNAIDNGIRTPGTQLRDIGRLPFPPEAPPLRVLHVGDDAGRFRRSRLRDFPQSA